MTTVTVNASRSYDIRIGPGLLSTLGGHAKALGRAKRVCIVSDTNVYPLYGSKAEESLREAGFQVSRFVFPAGESQKNGNTYLELLSALARERLTRTDLIVALGGGVTGDLAGFAAATYLRGIPMIQAPTTLLAAVDSSVGGKTAIDLPEGKNLAGAFYQPSLVLCDTDTLDTLPGEVFLEGCGEVIKYSVLYDRALFDTLLQTGPDFPREEAIRRCVELKRDVVMADEFDTGVRQKLNLGHTVGHGVEAGSGFTVAHGNAVAIGIAIVARASAKYGICSQETAREIISLIQRFGLPTATEYTAHELYSYALSDKKRAGDVVALVVPRGIGDCILLPTEVERLEAFIEAGL